VTQPGTDREEPSEAAVLSVRDLSVEFRTDDGPVQAVSNVSFDVFENEVLGIVGESGSGKTVTSLAVLGLLPKTANVTGEVRLGGRPMLGLRERELQALRGTKIAMVFQDALTALDPVFKVGSQIGEAISTHRAAPRGEIRERVVELLDLVGIPDAARRAGQYPHEYSGGMRQRAMIAMAIANDPDLLIADEPTTALDVTIQAQVLEVLERIQERTHTAILLITHDLGIVAGTADRVMVMYAGRQVELGTTDEIFYESRHPYTLGLLASLPRLDQSSRGLPLYRIAGQPPSLMAVPSGCAFHPRCPFARLPDPCSTDGPALRVVRGDHRSACHFADELADITPDTLRASAAT
jgi:oligopeptide/dipeptide ABC transporter ATP-binding protein